MSFLGRILIVRNYPNEVNINSYNLQEVGLAKELVKNGFDVDIVYFRKKKSETQTIYTFDGRSVNILWTNGYSLKQYVLFPSILKKQFLQKYDNIITTEYFQPMSYLISKIESGSTIIYHGPYMDGKYKFINNLLNMLTRKSIQKNSKKILVKSTLAKSYLEEKKVSNIKVVGVGLDASNLLRKDNFDRVKSKINKESNDLLLYIGHLDERRNISFLLRTFKKILEKRPNTRLLLIGKGKKENTSMYFNEMKELGIKDQIIYIEQVEQADLKYVYEQSDLFLFPSKVDIFGMVLLESMFFGTPVVSSKNGGANTIINEDNGIVIEDFNEEKWAIETLNLLEDRKRYKNMASNAKSIVTNNFLWQHIAKKFIDTF